MLFKLSLVTQKYNKKTDPEHRKQILKYKNRSTKLIVIWIIIIIFTHKVFITPGAALILKL